VAQDVTTIHATVKESTREMEGHEHKL